VAGISGATIMGDGKVALILDVQALAASHTSRAV
jgi:chemotaxis protein histidine kinase CheA